MGISASDRSAFTPGEGDISFWPAAHRGKQAPGQRKPSGKQMQVPAAGCQTVRPVAEGEPASTTAWPAGSSYLQREARPQQSNPSARLATCVVTAASPHLRQWQPDVAQESDRADPLSSGSQSENLLWKTNLFKCFSALQDHCWCFISPPTSRTPQPCTQLETL